MKKKIYETPSLQVEEIKVEKGFAGSEFNSDTIGNDKEPNAEGFTVSDAPGEWDFGM